MALKAVTRIEWGGTKDGKPITVTIEPGESVDRKLPPKVIEELTALGSVAEPAPEVVRAEDRNAELEAEVARLRAELAEAQKKPTK